MVSSVQQFALGLVSLVALVNGVAAQAHPYADAITTLTLGPSANFGVSLNMLEAPQGGGPINGSNHVFALGVGGSTVLHLNIRMWNGPGTDLIVYENPFFVSGSVWSAFCELLFVEVSTNGIDFARFPNDFDGPPGPYLQGGAQLGADVTYYDGFAGVYPVSAFPPGVNPLNVVAGGGDAFDLADLLDHPLVLGGQVNLDDINFVRLIDVAGGAALDDDGQIIWDVGFPAFASADVDAVCGVNNNFNALPGRPRIEMSQDDSSGLITLRIEDDNGLNDLKPGLSASLNGIEVPFGELLQFFVITAVDPFGATLVTGPIPQGFPRSMLKVAAVDSTGLTGGDAFFLKE